MSVNNLFITLSARRNRMRRKEQESNKQRKKKKQRNTMNHTNHHQFPAGMIKKPPTYSPARGRNKRNKHHTHVHRLRKELLFQKGL